MISRLTHMIQLVKNVERNLFRIMFGQPPKEFALAYVHDNKVTTSPKKFSLKDIIGDGMLLAVPKFRRTIEKRWKRKYGSPEYVWKMIVPKNNIKVCQTCGHHHEKGLLCENCYSKVKQETEEIQAKIQEKLGINPIENDVVVLYQGETLPDQILYTKTGEEYKDSHSTCCGCAAGLCFSEVYSSINWRPNYARVAQTVRRRPYLIHCTPEPKEFWKGKRVIEMKKERPKFFSKNLLEKTTQQPSTATDVKPTDLA